jgi:hypothetical protein
VNGLIADKSELIGVAHAYEEQLAAQRLSEADVKYLTENLFPIVTKLAEESAASNQSDPRQAQAMIDVIRPLVSTEALTILQVIGFNFKRAIGEPLTDLVRSLIVARAAPSVATQQDLQSLTLKRETLIYEIALNQEAHVRLMRLFGATALSRNWLRINGTPESSRLRPSPRPRQGVRYFLKVYGYPLPARALKGGSSVRRSVDSWPASATAVRFSTGHWQLIRQGRQNLRVQPARFLRRKIVSS